jgi:hypothetical protein
MELNVKADKDTIVPLDCGLENNVSLNFSEISSKQKSKNEFNPRLSCMLKISANNAI